MIFRLLCPSGHVLDVDAQLAGRKIRCGACGRIMVVPMPGKGPVRKPAARPATKPVAKPQPAPLVKPSAKPPVAPQTKRPTAEPPPAKTPNLRREPGMVAVPLPPVAKPQEIAAPVGEAVVRRWTPALRIPSWLHKLWLPAERQLPADATIPGTAEQRIALQLAAAPAAAALVGATPALMYHANLLTAPPWALAAVFLAVLQLIYAAWMINAPDWASARVQMVVSACIATIYGMLMTLTMITPSSHTLILRLGEVRRAAPAWCGLMLVLMGAATWYCGWTSARWRRSVTERRNGRLD